MQDGLASDTVTAVRIPANADAEVFMRRSRDEHSTVFGGGEGPLRGKIFRVGHMGLASRTQLSDAINVATRLLL